MVIRKDFVIVKTALFCYKPFESLRVLVRVCVCVCVRVCACWGGGEVL
jgi:hypothetical protein